MEREELRTVPLDHPWTPDILRDHFAAVMGGVAFPGRRPGFAVVTGLCHPRAEGDLEIHALAEAESPDLGQLLRACRGLGRQYRLPGTSPNERFVWMGDGKHVGAREIIWRLNREAGNEYNQLDIQYTTLLDNPTPYLSIFSLLSDLTQPDQKRMFFHGSSTAYSVDEVPEDERADARFGDCPTTEALAFVVEGLRTWLETHAGRPVGGNTNPYRNWPRFRRSGRR